MKKLTININIILFTLIFLLMLSPIIFSIYEIKNPHLKELKGTVETTKKPKLNWNSWFEESYQSQFDNYLKDNIEVRSFFVRLNNQIDFSLFNKPNANKITIGKDNFLFENFYIKSYLGENFIGSEKMEEKVSKIRELNDTLSNYNKDLLVIIAPGKAYLYPEKIPDRFFKKQEDSTNYHCFLNKLSKYNISFIDFNNFFINKTKAQNQLPVPKTGIHWSYFSAIEVMDSLTNYFEKKYKIDLPEIIIDSIYTSDKAFYTDADAEEALNLFFEIPKPIFQYHKFHIDEKDKDTLKILTNADSFYWIFYANSLIKRVFSDDTEFWYYNKSVYSPKFNDHKGRKASEIDIKESVLKHDVIILMTTEANLENFPWGFSESVLNAFKNNN